MKLMLALGKCTGLPGPWELHELFMPPEVIAKEEARAVQAFEALLESAIATPAGDSSSLSRSSSRKTNAASAATGNAYRALRQLVVGQCDDPDLLRCGLEKVRAQDGTVEWVAPESKERFVREGKACLVWNQQGA